MEGPCVFSALCHCPRFLICRFFRDATLDKRIGDRSHPLSRMATIAVRNRTTVNTVDEFPGAGYKRLATLEH